MASAPWKGAGGRQNGGMRPVQAGFTKSRQGSGEHHRSARVVSGILCFYLAVSGQNLPIALAAMPPESARPAPACLRNGRRARWARRSPGCHGDSLNASYKQSVSIHGAEQMSLSTARLVLMLYLHVAKPKVAGLSHA